MRSFLPLAKNTQSHEQWSHFLQIHAPILFPLFSFPIWGGGVYTNSAQDLVQDLCSGMSPGGGLRGPYMILKLEFRLVMYKPSASVFPIVFC